MRLETIKIGRIVNAHGIRGEVRVQPDGQDPAFLTQFQTFYLDGAPVTPTANHVHKSLVLMKFPGVAAALSAPGRIHPKYQCSLASRACCGRSSG